MKHSHRAAPVAQVAAAESMHKLYVEYWDWCAGRGTAPLSEPAFRQQVEDVFRRVRELEIAGGRPLTDQAFNETVLRVLRPPSRDEA